MNISLDPPCRHLLVQRTSSVRLAENGVTDGFAAAGGSQTIFFLKMFYLLRLQAGIRDSFAFLKALNRPAGPDRIDGVGSVPIVRGKVL